MSIDVQLEKKAGSGASQGERGVKDGNEEGGKREGRGREEGGKRRVGERMSGKGGGGAGSGAAGGGGAAAAMNPSSATAEQVEDLMNQLLDFNPTVRTKKATIQ